jgi:citrate lyase synthetase
MKVNPSDYQKGSPVVCILNNRATLTVGKEYIIEDVEIYGDEISLWLKNDDTNHYSYEAYRFVPKSNFRQYTIDQILK